MVKTNIYLSLKALSQRTHSNATVSECSFSSTVSDMATSHTKRSYLGERSSNLRVFLKSIFDVSCEIWKVLEPIFLVIR